MTNRSFERTATIVIALVMSAAVLIAISAVEPLLSLVAEAQDEPAGSASGVQTPPQAPGKDSIDGSSNAAVESDMAPGTPAAPLLASDVEMLPDVPGVGVTSASLGGSDVAVASVGGSYQVDSPHKKRKRSPVPPPLP